MNPTSMVLRWYRQSTGQANPQHQPYTTEEVLQLLRPNDAHDLQTANQGAEHDVRSAAVHQVAARPAAWLAELTKQQRREIGALADRLPSLVFHHAIGGQTEELVRRFGGWSTWRYERALEVAGSCIASHLNGTQTL
jgi:hypothetical protein